MLMISICIMLLPNQAIDKAGDKCKDSNTLETQWQSMSCAWLCFSNKLLSFSPLVRFQIHDSLTQASKSPRCFHQRPEGFGCWHLLEAVGIASSVGSWQGRWGNNGEVSHKILLEDRPDKIVVSSDSSGPIRKKLEDRPMQLAVFETITNHHPYLLMLSWICGSFSHSSGALFHLELPHVTLTTSQQKNSPKATAGPSSLESLVSNWDVATK